MNRAFISLYLFIVASVILMGWGLNTFWARFIPEQQITTEIKAVFTLLERELTANPDEAHVQQLARELALELQLLALDDLANSLATEQLQAGVILVAGDETTVIWYKRLTHTDKVLMLSISDADAASTLYKMLLLLFYAGVALVIYLWVWPLSRDANKLEAQTRVLGKDGIPETLDLSTTSTLYPLAQAFNHMAQRLRELIASHREMTNAVSHELRTPLARMKFALAMLEDHAQDKSRKQLNSIQQDINEMESLIGSLLMYAGFEQNSQQLQQCEGHMLDLLNEIRLRFARHNACHLILDIHDYSDGAAFFCEWKLMETVLQNVINNAARYARTRILIGLEQSATAYRIFIEDDGPGVPVAERQRVFDSFVRLYSEEQPGKSLTGGFGLGLAIVKRIMKWHCGDARFETPQYLSGARIQLQWPRRPDDAK